MKRFKKLYESVIEDDFKEEYEPNPIKLDQVAFFIQDTLKIPTDKTIFNYKDDMGRGLLDYLIGNKFAYEHYKEFKKILNIVPKHSFMTIYAINDKFIHDLVHLIMVKKDYKLFKEMYKYVSRDVFNYDWLSPAPYILLDIIQTKDHDMIKIVMESLYTQMPVKYFENVILYQTDILLYAFEVGGEKLRDFVFSLFKEECITFVDKNHNTPLHNFLEMEPLDKAFIAKMIEKCPKEVFNIRGKNGTVSEILDALGNEKLKDLAEKRGDKYYWVYSAQ